MAWQSTNACWTGCSASPSARPSMVVTSQPSVSAARKVHELTGRPSTKTVQAPHTCASQDGLTPVSPSSSRRKSMSRVRAAISRSTSRQFTVTRTSSDSVMTASLPLAEDPADEDGDEVTLVVFGAVPVGQDLRPFGDFTATIEVEPLSSSADGTDGQPCRWTLGQANRRRRVLGRLEAQVTAAACGDGDEDRGEQFVVTANGGE